MNASRIWWVHCIEACGGSTSLNLHPPNPDRHRPGHAPFAAHQAHRMRSTVGWPTQASLHRPRAARQSADSATRRTHHGTGQHGGRVLHPVATQSGAGGSDDCVYDPSAGGHRVRAVRSGVCAGGRPMFVSGISTEYGCVSGRERFAVSAVSQCGGF